MRDLMPRTLSIAIVYSVAIHLALLLLADWLLQGEDQPATINTPLIVSIERAKTTGAVIDHRRAAPAAESGSSMPQPESVATSSEPQAEGNREPVDDAASLPAPPDVEQVAQQVVVARPAIDEPAVPDIAPSAEPVAVTRTTFTPKQQKMLSRKVREWGENLHKMPELASGQTWNYKGQEYLAKFTQLPAQDDMGIERVIVEISTEQDGKRLTSEAQLKRLAFSNYGQFVNRWDPDVEIHNDEMDGRFHSNTAINLRYDREAIPVFHGKVTTTRGINVTDGRRFARRDQVFAGGLQTGVRSIRLPKHFLPFPDDAELSDEQLHRFAEDTRITFHADGSYTRQVIGTGSPELVAILSDATTYLVADRKAKLHLKGTVNGKVLVYSPERIVIEDDIVYAQHPEQEPDADDYLGLVSDKYVEIAPPDVTGPGDLAINAAIYAKRRFTVRGRGARENALLYLYGSLSAGTLSATEPRFYTRIEFDPRLEELRPPGFPMTERYEVESWNAAWDVASID